MENTFKKYTSGVYCMKSDNADFKHGDETTIATRRGKEVDVIVWKKLKQNDEFSFYSFVRQDGFCRTEWTRRKMERAENAATRQEKISNDEYEKAQEGKDFLVLGEPIKIGHHSEKRHRALIDRNWKRMGKSVAASEKAKEYDRKASELEYRLNKEINIDTPESIDLLKERIADLEEKREAIKARDHEKWELSNLGANIRRYKKRLETAQRLWDLEVDSQAPTRQETREQEKLSKQDRVNALLNKYQVIWAFSEKQFDTQAVEGFKYASIGAGGFIPVQHIEAFTAEFKLI